MHLNKGYQGKKHCFVTIVKPLIMHLPYFDKEYSKFNTFYTLGLKIINSSS
jgi:hypothetical protein